MPARQRQPTDPILISKLLKRLWLVFFKTGDTIQLQQAGDQLQTDSKESAQEKNKKGGNSNLYFKKRRNNIALILRTDE